VLADFFNIFIYIQFHNDSYNEKNKWHFVSDIRYSTIYTVIMCNI
jgi:hypothetical protein